MNIGFTGHRNKHTEDGELGWIAHRYPGAIWIHGGAIGFDSQVAEYAKEHGIEQIVVKPEYDKWPKMVAPLKRNEVIVDMADMMVACYDGRFKGGTKATIRYAVSKGKPVVHVTCHP